MRSGILVATVGRLLVSLHTQHYLVLETPRRLAELKELRSYATTE